MKDKPVLVKTPLGYTVTYRGYQFHPDTYKYMESLGCPPLEEIKENEEKTTKTTT